MKYYKCEICGNIFSVIDDSGVVPKCCGQDMAILNNENPSDAHAIMVNESETMYDAKRIRVCIGENVLHPMNTDHYIKFIGLVTDKSTHTYFFNPGDKPCAKFFIRKNENIQRIYAYCNIHGMYKTDFI